MSAALHQPAAIHASTNTKAKHPVSTLPPSVRTTPTPVQALSSRSTSENGSRPESVTMAPPVNRKKQKRRQKQAARLAAEHHEDLGSDHPLRPLERQYSTQDQSDIDEGDLYDHDDIDDDEDARDDRNSNNEPMMNGNGTTSTSKSKKKKKKSKIPSTSQTLADESSTSLSAPSATTTRSQLPLPPLPGVHTTKKPKDRIWNTSTQEERENIKKFWLELGEDERRALVKVEKDAVLKKMKEQQKHSCSCTVCGRKRTAIEEELEVLYDAYYEELEQYANNNQGTFENGAPIVPPPRLYHHNLHALDHHTHIHNHHHPSHGRVHEIPDDEDDLEDDYDEEEDDEEEPYSDDELDDDSRGERADFFAFGNSLTVKDGILTVADDLLKNDGKHFIDMMEQLAERRMQREEDTQYGMVAAHQSYHAGHNHGPLDEEDYDDEEEEDYDSQEEEDYEDDEMDTMTEEQRMEEGRRMFQIFAARMFEQRVLTAYREKVAQQRQELLLQELLEEQTLNEQRSAKRAREAQKKKDKKKQQKQAREEEKARKDAEKAAEEAAARALEEKKLEEQKRKKEELRKRKEAEKRALEEERLRKEAEKQKRLQEERERQAEIERKQREQKERERKKREEAKRREREEREVKEKELRDKKAKEEQDRRLRGEQANRDTESASKTESTGKERSQSQSASQPTASGPRWTSQAGTGTVLVPPGLQSPQGAPITGSPHYQVATPMVHKASTTPARPRQPSQQGSYASSPRSQATSGPEPLSSISPQSLPLSQPSSTPISSSGKFSLSQQPMLHHPQPSAPLSPLGGAGRSHPLGYPTVNGLPSHPPPGMPGVATRPIGNDNIPLYPPSGPLGSQYRGFPAPNGVLLPPGIGGSRPMPGPNRGYPIEPGHNLGFSGAPGPGIIPTTQPSGRSAAHSRQASGSFDRQPMEGHPINAPISRPTPIKRPSSPQKGEGRTNNSDVDDLSAQLGSSALLDDSDVPFATNLSQSLPGAPVPSAFGLSRASFGAPPFPDPLSPAKHPSFSGQGNTWAAQSPFGVPFATSWNTATGGTWPSRPFGAGSNHRTHASRPVAIRLLVIQAIKHLNSMSPSKYAPGFHEVNRLLRQVEQLKSPNEPPIALNEMIDICDTEGSPQNGGGSFIIKEDGSGSRYVKFEQDSSSPLSSHRGSFVPGDIGSPVPASSIPAPFGGIGTAPGVRQFSSPTSF